MLEGEEVVPRYKFALFFYYAKEHEDEKLDEKAHNFELHIHYVVEQEATTKGIEMSKGIELVFHYNLTKRKTNNSRSCTCGCQNKV